MDERTLTAFLNANETNESTRNFVLVLYRGDRDFWDAVGIRVFHEMCKAFHAGMKETESKP